MVFADVAGRRFQGVFYLGHVRNADLRGVAGYPDAPETENLKRERRPLEAGAPACRLAVIPVFSAAVPAPHRLRRSVRADSRTVPGLSLIHI